MAISAEELNRIYRAELGRDAGTEGLEYWTQGGTSLTDPAQIRRLIAESEEGQLFDQFEAGIGETYTNLLGRDVRDEGRGYFGDDFRSYIAQGLTADQALANIEKSVADSPEAAEYLARQARRQELADQGGTSMFDTSMDYMKFAAEGTKDLAGFTPDIVFAGTFPGVDISQYMNPYTQQVIDQSMADIERQRLMQQQQTAAQAQAAGAFGGSRQGVAQALTNEAFARQAAQTSANLRQQGFGQATGLAQADLNRQMQAQQLNQAAGLQGAQFRLGAQSQLGGMGLTGYNLAQTELDRFMANEAAKQAQQNQLYGQQIGQAQSFFGQPAQSLGYVPSAITGMPYSQTTTGGYNPGVFDYLTLGAMLSDQQLKTDIEEIKTLDNGIKVVSWKWNETGKKIADLNQPTIGVIAQQIAKIIPEAVKKHASGYLMVDYSHPELRGI